MRHIFYIICFIIPIASVAQGNYEASLISKDLLPYASAVVRNEETTIEVRDIDNVIYHKKRAITVLNKNGDDLAHMVIFYNKSINIRYIKGVAYNEFGKLIAKFSESDFSDESVTDNVSLYQDERVKHYIPSITQYPYTIEYEYELRLKQSLVINTWEPNPEYGLAVEKSTFSFICKPDFNIRYKETNILGKATITAGKDGLKLYNWQIEKMKAVKFEPLSPYSNTYLSSVQIAPEKFSYYGVKGSFTNWQQLGKWEYDNLLANKTDIPAETAQHILEITAGVNDTKLKAKKIYEYMQQKTHYISVQVGIGGFQPFPASDVDRNGFGDCKALVNYTKALLKNAGIDSYYCVVHSGSDDNISLQSDFASMNQGDHIILCIPFKNDTTWLECTSQHIPFGFLGDFTDNRTVLACTPEGGKLMHTPIYSAAENLEKRKASFNINDSGTLTGSMETLFKGTDYEDREKESNDAPVEKIKDIKKIYPINNLELEKLEYVQDKGLKPVTTENIKLSAREYAALNNGKLYFSINSFDRYNKAPRQIRNRQMPVYINRGYTEEDEITYTLPKGYSLDSDPLNITIAKLFGNYTATMTIKGDQLVYSRKFQLKDGTYSKDIYQDLVDFYQSVVDADNYNVTLVKK